MKTPVRGTDVPTLRGFLYQAHKERIGLRFPNPAAPKPLALGGAGGTENHVTSFRGERTVPALGMTAPAPPDSEATYFLTRTTA